MPEQVIEVWQIERLLEQYDELAGVVDVVAKHRGLTPNQVWAERMTAILNSTLDRWLYENKIAIG